MGHSGNMNTPQLAVHTQKLVAATATRRSATEHKARGDDDDSVTVVVVTVVVGAVGLRLGAKVGAVGAGESVGDGDAGRSPVRQP